jgi:hypothetical protein
MIIIAVECEALFRAWWMVFREEKLSAIKAQRPLGADSVAMHLQ